MSNPVFRESILNENTVYGAEPMTINGAINKTFLLLAMLVLSAGYTWSCYAQGLMDKVNMLMVGGIAVGFISVIILMFNRSITKYLAPVYAVAEGLAIGGLSAMFEQSFPGIVIQAIGGTMLALASMLVLYRTGVIKCSEKFTAVLMTATMSIAGIYLVELIMGFFGYHIPGIFSNGLVGIGFSVAVVIIASLNLIIDFEFIVRGSERMLDKTYEWYGAFGLLVTLVWLYIEILNLLAKMRNK